MIAVTWSVEFQGGHLGHDPHTGAEVESESQWLVMQDGSAIDAADSLTEAVEYIQDTSRPGDRLTLDITL